VSQHKPNEPDPSDESAKRSLSWIIYALIALAVIGTFLTDSAGAQTPAPTPTAIGDPPGFTNPTLAPTPTPTITLTPLPTPTPTLPPLCGAGCFNPTLGSREQTQTTEPDHLPSKARSHNQSGCAGSRCISKTQDGGFKVGQRHTVFEQRLSKLQNPGQHLRERAASLWQENSRRARGTAWSQRTPNRSGSRRIYNGALMSHWQLRFIEGICLGCKKRAHIWLHCSLPEQNAKHNGLSI
jgi:hypothetical protein